MNAHPMPDARRFLVLAHHEGGHEPVLHEARRLMAETPTAFHVLVPTTPPPDEGWVWDESDAAALARDRLRAALADFASIGAKASGEIADADPVDAVIDALGRQEFAGLIVSTLPDSVLERLHLDLVHRLRRCVRLPLVHLVARDAVKA